MDRRSRLPSRTTVGALVVVLAMVSACTSSDGGERSGSATTSTADASSTTVAPSVTVAQSTTAPRAVTTIAADGRLPVILDYSPTISDIGALFYLAANPDVDLLAVTLPERGESDCDRGTQNTRSLLLIAGRPDVPVECGLEAPLFGDRDWPDAFREFANELNGVSLPEVDALPPGDAAQLLANTLESADRLVTIVAVGPLTNLGVLLRDRPELTARIDRVVIMGGAVDVPGNVAAAPTAEWNLHIDPEAARLVLASGVDVLIVPLDATNDVPWTDALVAQLGLLVGPVAKAEQQVIASRGFTDGVYLWDELAAVATLHPEVLTTKRRTIIIDDDGATVDHPDGAAIDVAVGADARSAMNEFFRIVNGGALPDTPEATPEEQGYSEAIEAGFAEFAATIDATTADPDGDAHVEVDRFLADVFLAVTQLTSTVGRTDPPDSVAAEHADLHVALQALAASEDALRGAAAAADGDDFWLLLESGLSETSFDQQRQDVFTACTKIADYLLLRAGALSCREFEN